MEPKKVSFGFSKLAKKPSIIVNNKPEEKKVELIDCLEGQSIKIKDAVEEVKQPLIIPLKDNEKNLLDRIKAAKVKEKIKNTDSNDILPDSELSIEELAARELVKEAKERLAKGATSETKTVLIPSTKQEPSLEGEKESTLEDYESVPIADYGLALLRGMGWREGVPIGKNAASSIPVSVPELRPKGLGLGASKMIQSEMPEKKAVDKDGNELILVIGAFAKLIAGSQKGNFCEVQGFDEEAGRVIVKVFPKGEILNVNELMLIPVTKEEFSIGSKILNNAKYETYKEISDRKLEDIKIKKEHSTSGYHSPEDKKKSSKLNSNIERSSAKYRSDDDSERKSRDRTKKTNHLQSNRDQKSSESSDEEYDSRNRHKSKNKYSSGSKKSSKQKSKYKDLRDCTESSSSESEEDHKYLRKTHRRKETEKSNSRKDSTESSSSESEEDQKTLKKKHRHKETSNSRRGSTENSSSVSEEDHRSSRKKHKSKHKSKSRRDSTESMSEEDHRNSRKKHKSKCKREERDRSTSRSGHQKSSKYSYKKKPKESSDSEKELKRDKRKRNKCKSRHRRDSSGSRDRKEDNSYRSKR